MYKAIAVVGFMVTDACTVEIDLVADPDKLRAVATEPYEPRVVHAVDAGI